MEKKNYIAEFYRNERKYENFFNLNSEEIEEKIKKVNSEINKLRRSLDTKVTELENIYLEGYSQAYTKTNKSYIICYNGSASSYKNERYRLPEGDYLGTDEDNDNEVDAEVKENTETLHVNKKNGIVNIVDGYCYPLGSAVIKKYKYSMGTVNKKISLKLIDTILVGILERTTQSSNKKYYSYDEWINAFRKINGTEFINTMYNIDRKMMSLTLEDVRYFATNVASFETVIKTCPENIVDSVLRHAIRVGATATAMPVYKILGITKEGYNMFVAQDLEVAMIELRPYIVDKERFNKTEQEWIELIRQAKSYEQDLDFYKISYDEPYYNNNSENNKIVMNQLLNLVCKIYATSSELQKGYSIGKLLDYVVAETINQGYTRIRHFLSELIDYLNMCNNMNIAPTYYSSYLKQTHDIAARNHRIILEEKQEEMFKNAYKDYKPWTNDDNYTIIAPECSHDLIKEGDSLNHCVGSYIRRVCTGECKILFMRLKDKIEESLITIEIRKSKDDDSYHVNQVKGMHNRKPSNAEIDAIQKFTKARKIEYKPTVY